MKTPKWIKVLRVLSIFSVIVMGLNLWISWQEDSYMFEEMMPVSLILLGLTHLVFRAPFKNWAWWEALPVFLSITLATSGAFLFTPEDEERNIAFQTFFASFIGLATSYGFFCTAIPEGHRLREKVIEPTKKVSHFGIVGFDIGLVLSPFAFVFFLLRELTRGES